MDRAYVSPTPLIWPVRGVKTEVWVATEPTWLPSEYSFGETIQIKGKKPTSMIQSLYFIVLFLSRPSLQLCSTSLLTESLGVPLSYM